MKKNSNKIQIFVGNCKEYRYQIHEMIEHMQGGDRLLNNVPHLTSQ